MKRLRVICMLMVVAALGAVAVEKGYEKKEKWIDSLLEWKAAAKQTQTTVAPVPLPDFGKESYTVCMFIRTQSSEGSLFGKTKPKGDLVPQDKGLAIIGGKLKFGIGWVGVLGTGMRVSDGKWHHVAFCGGPNQKIYVDGNLAGQGSLRGGADVRGSVFKIGQISTT